MVRTSTISKQSTKEKITVSNFIKKFAAISLMVAMLAFLVFPIGTVNAETSTSEGATDVIQINTFYGDLNNDYAINSIDYALMKSLILDNIVYKKAADLNGDMSVNSLDLYIMKQFLLERMHSFPVADTLVETKNGSVINVEQNKTFEISLKENGSTGYQWYYTVSDLDALNLISEENINYTNPELVGSPIQKVWSFEALKPGTYTLTYEYKRPWEKDVEPIETVQCTINVLNPNEHVINVDTNKTFDISMQEGGFAGFTSTCKISDETAMQLISQVVDNPNPQVPDMLYSRVYTFKALKSGTYEIVFTPKPAGDDIIYVINVK